MEGLRVKYAVVFKADRLDLEGLKNTLSDWGEIFEIDDDELLSNDGKEKTPVKVVYIDMPFGKAFRFKLEFNCVEAEDNQYVLFPMENYQEKLSVLNQRAAQ